MNKFTDKQIEVLTKAFSKFETLTPENEATLNLILARAPTAALEQLASLDIRHVSAAANKIIESR